MAVLVVASGFTGLVAADHAGTHIDDFEDGDISDWTGDTGAFTTTTSTAANGSYSLKGQSDSVSSWETITLDIESGQHDFAWAQQYGTWAPSGYYSGKFMVADGSGTTGIRLAVDDSGNLHYNDGGSWAGTDISLQQDTWYRYEMEVDYSANTYHVTVVEVSSGNTVGEVTDVPMANSIDSASQISVNKAGGPYWWDDIYTTSSEPTYTLDGAVTNARTGEAVSGVDVTAINASSGEVVATATTGDSGQYSFDLGESGDYTVRVGSDGYATDEQTVTVDSATTHDVALAVEAVAGSVTGDGALVDGASVELRNGDTVIDSATTDTSGEYTLQPDQPGKYTVHVDTSDYGSDSVDIDTRDQTSVNFDLSSTVHSFEGTVFDVRTSDAVENATVELVDSSGDVVASATTDSSGQYSLGDVSEGEYTLRVEADGYVADEYDVTVAGPTDKPVALAPSNTWTYDLSGSGDSMWAVYESSGTVDVTVEGYDSDAEEWVTVHEQTYSPNGTTDSTEVLEINATTSGYDEYRLTMSGDAKPSAVGITAGTPIFGLGDLAGDVSDFSGLPRSIVLGAMVAGGVWLVLRARN